MLEVTTKKQKYGNTLSYKTFIYDDIPVQENPKVFPAVMTKISFHDNEKMKIIVSTVRLIKDDKTTYYKYSKSGELKDLYELIEADFEDNEELIKDKFVFDWNRLFTNIITLEGNAQKGTNLLELSKNVYLQEKNKYAEEVYSQAL